MNRRIYVGAMIIALAAVLGIVAFSGSSIINDVSEGGFLSNTREPIEILPVKVELENLSILEVSETSAVIEIKFKVTNPNHRSVILQIISFQLYEDGIRVAGGQIGTREEGMVASSNYYMLLQDRPTVLTDQIILKNTGGNPELWSALTNDDASWRITGDAYFNLSSLTNGEENTSSFDFVT